MAGPRGDMDNDRAGEPGEYHHSRNLMKKMAVGRRSLKESSSNWGDRNRSRRRTAKNPLFWEDITFCFAWCASCPDGKSAMRMTGMLNSQNHPY
jgi:hypothetical protein